MKLTRNTEWAVIGALILYIAFTPGIQAVKTALATPVGKAIGLAVIVYVWKFVSPIIALLLIISFVRCATWNVWELFSGAEAACTCENSAAIWDPQSKTCKDTSGNAAGAVKTCTCANGYAWDGGEKGKKECIPITSDQPPIPATPPALPGVEMGTGTSLGASAPATAGTPAPTPVPETTGSAAAQTMASTAPLPAAPGGAQPGAGTTSAPASV